MADDDKKTDDKQSLRFVKPVNKAQLIADVTAKLKADYGGGAGGDLLMAAFRQFLPKIVEIIVAHVGAEFAPEGETPKAHSPAGSKAGDPAYDRAHSPEHAPAPPALHDDPHTDPGDGQPSAVAGKGGKAPNPGHDTAKQVHDAVKAEAEASAKPAAKKA